MVTTYMVLSSYLHTASWKQNYLKKKKETEFLGKITAVYSDFQTNMFDDQVKLD